MKALQTVFLMLISDESVLKAVKVALYTKRQKELSNSRALDCCKILQKIVRSFLYLTLKLWRLKIDKQSCNFNDQLAVGLTVGAFNLCVLREGI